MNLREQFADKKWMAQNYSASMSFNDFRIAVGARGQMLADLASGDDNAYIGKPKPSRAEARQRRGNKKVK